MCMCEVCLCVSCEGCCRVSKCHKETRLTSLSGTFALHVHMAPLSVLFEGASLLVAATAVVALEGLLYCEREFQLISNT